MGDCKLRRFPLDQNTFAFLEVSRDEAREGYPNFRTFLFLSQNIPGYIRFHIFIARDDVDR